MTAAVKHMARNKPAAGTAVAAQPRNAQLHRHRDDFTSRFITCVTSGSTPMAAVDWDAATASLASGSLPCSGGERHILLLSAGLAHGTPVSLRATVTGLDDHNTALLVTAIRHAAGKRPENADLNSSRPYDIS